MKEIVKKVRSFDEAIEMIIAAWMKQIFRAKYLFDLPDGLQESERFQELSFNQRLAAARVDRFANRNQMSIFENKLRELLKKEGKNLDLISDYNPQIKLAQVVKESGFNSVILPTKMHTKINEKNQVWIRLGDKIGDTDWI